MLQCPLQQFPTDIGTLKSGLISALNTTQAALDQNSADTLLSQIYCAVGGDTCFGICPNPDISGIGVRIAFYLNAFMTSILVALDPQESPGAAWSSTILTASIVIPAIIQKRSRMLTLYHATLALDFATFSSVASLAVAPMCPVWRKIDNRRHPSHKPTVDPRSFAPSGSPRYVSSFLIWRQHESQTSREERHRARTTLSLALIAQVALQWGWATYLFTSPYYAQSECNPSTVIVLFGRQLTAREINEQHFGLWSAWLLLSMAATLIYGILLVLSSTSGVNASQTTNDHSHNFKAWTKGWDSHGSKRRVLLFTTAAIVCLLLVINGERQTRVNCILLGENSTWGFGQLAALLFAIAPAWPIIHSLREGNDFTKWLSRTYKRFRPLTPQTSEHNPAEIPLLNFQPDSPPTSPDKGKGSPPRPFKISDGMDNISPVLSHVELTRSPSTVFQRQNTSRSSIHSSPRSVSFRLDASPSQVDNTISPRSRLRRSSSSYDDLGGLVPTTEHTLRHDASSSVFHMPERDEHGGFLREIPLPVDDGSSPNRRQASPSIYSQVGEEV